MMWVCFAAVLAMMVSGCDQRGFNDPFDAGGNASENDTGSNTDTGTNPVDGGNIDDTGVTDAGCQPNCDGKQCGDNGCGGKCGTDYVPEYDKDNKCLSLTCVDFMWDVQHKQCVGDGAYCNSKDGLCYVPLDAGTPDSGVDAGESDSGTPDSDEPDGGTSDTGTDGGADASVDGGCTPNCVNKNCGDNGCGGKCDADYVPEYDKANKCLSLECNQSQQLEVIKKVCVGDDAYCDPSDGKCHVPFICDKQCANAACGDADSCGGKCQGTCLGLLDKCVDGVCKCQPTCTGVCGGDDGCKGTCPNDCQGHETCGGGGTSNVCGCTTDCSGKCDGPDSCGGICPDNCQGHETCGGGGALNVCGCTSVCDGKLCGDPDGCGGTCQSGSGCCAPSCVGAVCGGSDGCGGTCLGTCLYPNDICNPTTYKCDCTPSNCVGVTCGMSNGCGGLCWGTCPGTQDVCDNGHCLCQPACAGKICGASDGCGGNCLQGSGCCTPDCSGKCGGPNGCGGVCADNCQPPATCGGGGTQNVCGCIPTNCHDQGKNCGIISNGCGQNIDCGTCTSPATCNGGGTPNVCGCTPNCNGSCCPNATDTCYNGACCVKTTMATACSGKCGTVSDGCGGTYNCGGCVNGDSCVGNVCSCVSGMTCTGTCCGNATDVCNAGICCTQTPQATACSGKCGTVSDGCGGTYNCGGCVNGDSCVGNVCSCVSGMTCTGTCCGNATDVCNAGICCTQTPQATACAGKCGAVSDNCGGTYNCGGCSQFPGSFCNAQNVCDCTANCPIGVCGGPDTCGGTCPDNCVIPTTCGGGGTLNVCGCTADCVGKACGDADGCGGQCVGTCVFANAVCNPATFQCDCTPSTCVGAICGADNGCGGLCQGTCSGPQDVCTAGVCVCQPDCVGKACGDADGCGGQCVGTCVFANAVCNPATFQCDCTPSTCVGAICGADNGCGGLCQGTCSGPQDVCTAGVCVCQPDCVGKACGADGCGGSCGTCAFSEVCMSNGTCCTPNCAGAACGDANTCGGQCVGTCPGNDICNPTTYLCEPLELTRMVPGQFTVIYETWDAVGTSLGAVDLSTCDQTCRAQPRNLPVGSRVLICYADLQKQTTIACSSATNENSVIMLGAYRLVSGGDLLVLGDLDQLPAGQGVRDINGVLIKTYHPECLASGDCEDNNNCFTDVCQANNTCTHVYSETFCFDNNPDTSDVCVSPGTCPYPLTSVCTVDGDCVTPPDFCSGAGTCNTVTGRCNYPAITCLDDGNPLTLEQCDPFVGCVSILVECVDVTTCNDGKALTVDSCGADNRCLHPFQCPATSIYVSAAMAFVVGYDHQTPAVVTRVDRPITGWASNWWDFPPGQACAIASDSSTPAYCYGTHPAPWWSDGCSDINSNPLFTVPGCAMDHACYGLPAPTVHDPAVDPRP
mgnify:FL=1